MKEALFGCFLKLFLCVCVVLMADNSYDCVESDLLCTETTRALCFDDDLDSVATDRQTHQSDGGEGLIFGNGGSDPLIDFPILSEESFCLMVGRESQHMPADDYLNRLRSGELDLALRREALDWIWKVGLIFFFLFLFHPPIIFFCIFSTFFFYWLFVFFPREHLILFHFKQHCWLHWYSISLKLWKLLVLAFIFNDFQKMGFFFSIRLISVC